MQIVSLTTDFGLKDYYVAELKASVMSKKNDFMIIDISHDVNPFEIVQAAFLLNNCLPSFPENSIHIIGVNIHYKRKAEIICFTRQNHFFIGPNNGVFTLIFDDLVEDEVFVVPENPELFSTTSSIFAHAAAYLGHGLPIHEIGPQVTLLHRRINIQPVVTSNQIRATIIQIDHYENVIINLKKDQFEKIRDGRNFSLYYKQNDPITFLSKDYGDVQIGEVLAFFNTAGFLEIAMNKEKASSILNLNINETIQINFY
ncbi:MAG: SAM-dependent chlorinase/fluorinase [Saprospiraceae bacterium]|nr:SAM-dependent chlorinase/fluorinase [Saprospiraceae bacterium]